MGVIQPAGRTSDGRNIAGVVTTSGSAPVTAPAGSFGPGDVGRTITGTGIPAATTIASVQSGGAATLSQAATASGTITAAAGAAGVGSAAELALGFRGWSPESIAEHASYSVAAKNAGTPDPGRPTSILDDLAARQRSRT